MKKGDHNKKGTKKIGENGGNSYPRLHPRQLLPHFGLHRSSALLRRLPLQVFNVIDISSFLLYFNDRTSRYYVGMLFAVVEHWFVDGALHVCQTAGTCDARE